MPALLLGSLVGFFALLTAAIPLVSSPVPVSLECDRSTCTWALGDGKPKTFASSLLAGVRIEAHDGGTRITAGSEVLSNVASGPDVKEAHTRAVAAMLAFAGGTDPKLSLSYPVGGGAPGLAYWLSVVGALGFSASFIGLWLKKRGAA